MGENFPQPIKRHQSTQPRTSANTKEDWGGWQENLGSIINDISRLLDENSFKLVQICDSNMTIGESIYVFKIIHLFLLYVRQCNSC